MKRIDLTVGLMLLAGPGSVRAQEAATAAKALAPAESGPASRAGAAGIEWVRIPGGTFTMGSADADLTWSKPTRQVTVKSFQMARTLVTNKQYKACVAAGACTAAHISDGTCLVNDGTAWYRGDLPDSFLGDDQPTVCVDWEQAKKFSEWTGGRLPTEAEWEYAARSGGRDRKFPWGNEKATCERAVISEGDDGALGCGKNSTWPVCSKPAGNTRQGLCDMAGNAWEWVQDRFHNSYAGAPADGNSREGPGANRVVRGGSFRLSAENARCALRGGVPGDRDFTLGFRPARAIPARRLKQE